MADLRSQAIESVETAVAHLAEALDHLDRLPVGDRSAVGLAAHAIDNYISVAEGALGLLADSLRDHPNPEVMGWVEGLRHLGTLMSHAVGRLFQTTGQGDLPLTFEEIDLAKLLGRVCEYYRSRAERKGLEITCHSETPVARAWGDRVAVAVIADNLLSNAVKFSRPPGHIQVEILPGPGGVACRVCDAGPGLTPIEQSRLFQPGARVGPATAGGESSSRYGLTIVKELVERMEGRVWVESPPGQGACFSFRIPYASAGTGG